MTNILFVCTGNINRSPAAQIILKKLSPSSKVDSAALKNKKNLIITKRMREALQKHNYKYTEIRSKPLTKSLINWADIVFYMQPSHLRDLMSKFGTSNKYVSLAKYIGKTKIHDPAFDGTQEEVLKDIELAIKNYLKNKKIDMLGRSLFT